MSQESGFDRYARQIILGKIGKEGQKKLLQKKVVIIGCGALGSSLASLAARAGIGQITLYDRDVVELHNLQSQILYDEEDCKKLLPKAIAAQEKLKKINSDIQIEGKVEDLRSSNLLSCMEGADLVWDGTDNFQTRFLINDGCQKLQIPWVYAGVVATYGHVMPILPSPPCFHCYIEKPPAPGEGDTCDIVGVLGSAVLTIASFAFTEGLKILLDKPIQSRLTIIDLWNPQISHIQVPPRPDCPTCQKKEFPFLSQKPTASQEGMILCGHNAIQIRLSPLDLDEISQKLKSHGDLQRGPFLLRFHHPPYTLTLFQDGRALIYGTQNMKRARSFLAKFLGL